MTALSWTRDLSQRIVLGVILATIGIAHTLAQTPEGHTVQAYPSRPIRILTGNQAGSVSDLMARLIGDRLEQLWGKTVIVENRPGAGGTIAAEMVARSPADGYTLLMAGQSNLVLAQVVGKDLRFDALRDLAPIGRIAQVPYALAVNGKLPIGSVPELIEYAKAHPGQLTFATNGPGTLSQLSLELFTALTGTVMLAVPYKGVSSAMVDVVGGRVDLMLTDWVGLAPHVKSGALRLLGAADRRRLSAAPGVPTIAEQGVAGYAVGGWYGLLAPAGTPPEIFAKLVVVFGEARRTPEVRKRIEELGCEPIEDSPAQFRALIATELEKYSEIVRGAGIKTD